MALPPNHFKEKFDLDLHQKGYSAHNNHLLVGLCELIYEDIETIENQVKVWSMLDNSLKCVIEELGSLRFAVLHNDHFIIVIFKGTDPSSIRDWLININSIKEKFEEGEGNIHRGFYRAAQSLKDKISAIVKPLQEEGKDKKIYVTGHSLGGALAVISALICEELASFEHVTTIGQPKLGDKDFCKSLTKGLLKDRYYRIRNDGDFITVVPYLWTRHIGYTYIQALKSGEFEVVDNADVFMPRSIDPMGGKEAVEAKISALMAEYHLDYDDAVALTNEDYESLSEEAMGQVFGHEMQARGLNFIGDAIGSHSTVLYFKNVTTHKDYDPFEDF